MLINIIFFFITMLFVSLNKFTQMGIIDWYSLSVYKPINSLPNAIEHKYIKMKFHVQ